MRRGVNRHRLGVTSCVFGAGAPGGTGRIVWSQGVVANSLKSEDISYVESKHLLRVLGELNDIEIIRLGRQLYRTYGSGQDYWDLGGRLKSGHLWTGQTRPFRQAVEN